MKRDAWLAVLVGLIAYVNTLFNPFVYDDRTTVINNQSLRNLFDVGAVLRHDLHRPLVNVSYAIDYALFGLQPTGYHITNILLHLLNVVLVFRLTEHALLDARQEPGRTPLGAAALFAVHPLLSEAVGYTSARSGILATTFALASLLCMRRGLVERRRSLAAAAVGLMLLGIASKETAAMLPLVFVAYDRLLLDGDAAERRRRLWRVHVPLVAVMIVAGLARVVSFAFLELSSIRPLGQHLLTQLPIVWRYLALFVAPFDLSLAHGVRDIRSPLNPLFVLSIAGLLVTAWLLFRARRVAPVAVFGALWFALFLAPSSLIPLAEHMSEHRVYEGSVGLFIVAAALWSRARAPALIRRGAPVVVCVVFLGLTNLRNRVWAHPITLWTDAVNNAPDLWTAHYALANEYQYVGRCADALPEYQQAIRLRTTQRAVINVGTCLAQLGRTDEAERVFRTALRMGGGADPHFNLGLLALQRARPKEAAEHFREVIALDAGNIPARQALVNLHQTDLANPAEARRLCREIQKLAPSTPNLESCLGD